jgi:hypothetical protein
VKLACHAAAFAEAAQAVHAKETWERIISHAASSSSLIAGICVKIGCSQLVEWYCSHTFAPPGACSPGFGNGASPQCLDAGTLRMMSNNLISCTIFLQKRVRPSALVGK